MGNKILTGSNVWQLAVHYLHIRARLVSQQASELTSHHSPCKSIEDIYYIIFRLLISKLIHICLIQCIFDQLAYQRSCCSADMIDITFECYQTTEENSVNLKLI